MCQWALLKKEGCTTVRFGRIDRGLFTSRRGKAFFFMPQPDFYLSILTSSIFYHILTAKLLVWHADPFRVRPPPV